MTVPDIIEFVRHHVLSLPVLAKFALGMVMIGTLPRLSRWLHLPASVGLLIGGVIVGPYVLGFFGQDRPVADFMADIGKLLLMFFAGLEIDLGLFQKLRNRALLLGVATTVVPLVLGTAAGLALGYAPVPAIVIGSLLASHTLLGLQAIEHLGVGRLEPITVAIGATVLSDTLSLVVFAVCVSIFTIGFSPVGLAVLLTEIVLYILLVLFGLSRIGAYVLRKVENEEDAYFIIMLSFMAIAGVLAEAIQLPGIVGAFLAGLAVNASAQGHPASAKLEFLGKSLFIPIFFMVTGFLIDPVAFVYGLLDHGVLALSIIVALLVGKWIAAEAVGRWLCYSRDERLTVWSLTLPQVAATLAATIVAHQTIGPGGAPLLDDRMLNAVLVLMLTTSILGPILTERFGSRLVPGPQGAAPKLNA